MSSTPHPDERKQTWNADAYTANGRFVADMAGAVFAMLDPKPGERILDLGCGDGMLTARIAASGAVVTGCDADESMLAAAARHGLNLVRADMRALPFSGELDAVFSNAALHWVRDQAAVLHGVYTALRPGGRFAAEMGGLGNIAAIRTALSAVLRGYGIDAEEEVASSFPSLEAYSELLHASRFSVEHIELIARPTPLKTGMEQWLLTFRRGVFQQMPDVDRRKAVADTITLLKPILCDSKGNWWADYVRLRFHAVRD